MQRRCKSLHSQCSAFAQSDFQTQSADITPFFLAD
jgi:hypothetical protein